jgi:hypothetical protein
MPNGPTSAEIPAWAAPMIKILGKSLNDLDPTNRKMFNAYQKAKVDIRKKVIDYRLAYEC